VIDSDESAVRSSDSSGGVSAKEKGNEGEGWRTRIRMSRAQGAVDAKVGKKELTVPQRLVER
jgi:hypothetical protein